MQPSMWDELSDKTWNSEKQKENTVSKKHKLIKINGPQTNQKSCNSRFL